MYRKRRLIKSENGQSLVEFALVLPVLLLILLGIVEFGWLFNAQISMTSAAREGARVLAVQEIKGSLNVGAVLTEISGPINNNTNHLTFQNNVSINPTIVNSGSVTLGKVEVSGNVKNIVHFYTSEYVNLKGEASMRLENYNP